jgi:hypothetical protein
MDQLNTYQSIFILFFAIFWGLISNVQPRWKAFQFPLICAVGLRWIVLRRVALAVVVMNFLPIAYFAFALWMLRDKAAPPAWPTLAIVARGVLPAFAIFGMYRIWLGIVEFQPQWFYRANIVQVPAEYRHVEPTFRHRLERRSVGDKKEDGPIEGGPVVDVAEGAWIGNFVAAGVYIVVAVAALLL